MSAPAGSKAPPFSYPEQQSTSEPMMPDSLSPDLQKMHAYWRAALINQAPTVIAGDRHDHERPEQSH
jgi:hypothetical protein